MPLLAIRFLAELLGVGALGYLGATVPAQTAWRVVLGIGAPLALIAVWSVVVAPRAHNPIPPRARELIGTALLVLVAAALALAGQPGWGTALAATVVLDQILLLALNIDQTAIALRATAAEGGD